MIRLIAAILIILLIWAVLLVVFNRHEIEVLIRIMFQYDFCLLHPLERWCAPGGVRIGMTR